MLQRGQYEVVSLRGDRIQLVRRDDRPPVPRSFAPSRGVSPSSGTPRTAPASPSASTRRFRPAAHQAQPPAATNPSTAPISASSSGAGCDDETGGTACWNDSTPDPYNAAWAAIVVLVDLQRADQIGHVQRLSLEGGPIGTGRLRDLRSEGVELGLPLGHDLLQSRDRVVAAPRRLRSPATCW